VLGRGGYVFFIFIGLQLVILSLDKVIGLDFSKVEKLL
jgi:hypothetical protein